MLGKGFCLRILFSLAGMLVAAHFGYSQSLDWRSRIQTLMDKADSLSMLSQVTFHLDNIVKPGKLVKEAWHYTTDRERVVVFEVHYFERDTEFTEVYYLNRGDLVCMEQYQIHYPLDNDDKIVWGEVCFFDGNQVRQHVTIGENQSVAKYSRDDYSKLMQFRQRYRTLQQNMALMQRW